ncbi:MAG: hypothetical protein ASARMPREDX12_000949 [Alectoria sarmentosa]|nr:MAG: hypothetical protein ASARMPREDX12_000949 [Alectoria sarmentosa]
MDTTVTGLGSLSVLPLEIRDQIYSYVFAERYLIPTPAMRISSTRGRYAIDGPRFSARKLYVIGSPKPQIRLDGYLCANIGVLETSKVLRDEAARALHSGSKFLCSTAYMGETLQLHNPRAWRNDELLDKNNAKLIRSFASLLPPLQTRMQDVEVRIDITDYNRYRSMFGEERLRGLYRNFNVAAALGNANVYGKCFRIVFENCYAGRLPLHESPFVEIMKRLGGFETVVVELQCKRSDGFNPHPWLYQAVDRSLDGLLEGNDFMKEEYRVVMECVLGPVTVRDHDRTRYLEFHPRGYWAKLPSAHF